MAMEWIDTEVQLPREYQRVLLYTPEMEKGATP